jgi:hypothetical protein
MIRLFLMGHQPIDEDREKMLIDELYKALEAKEPNILGNRAATVEVNGDEYMIIESSAASRHNGANSWGRIIFKKNGKQIAKANIERVA